MGHYYRLAGKEGFEVSLLLCFICRIMGILEKSRRLALIGLLSALLFFPKVFPDTVTFVGSLGSFILL